MNEFDLDRLLETARGASAESFRALGRLIRIVDDRGEQAEPIDKAIMSAAFKAARIGITGPPGSGKSSLISSASEILTGIYRKKIGVLAVDPTSPFTGGALLGDRVRLKNGLNERIFFRSLASRGELGGVSRTIQPASRILDWWGADIILIETVGSGQLGTGVADVADLVVAILTPEAGDGIQSMKAGIMELADCFIVNKSDRPGSSLMSRELALVKEEAECSGRSVEVYLTSAIEDKGIGEAIEGISALYEKLKKSGEIEKRRHEQIKREIALKTEARIKERVMQSLGGPVAFENELKILAKGIIAGDLTPTEAAEKIIARIEKHT